MQDDPVRGVCNIVRLLQAEPGAHVPRRTMGVPFGKRQYGISLKEAVQRAEKMGLVTTGDDGRGLGYEWVALVTTKANDKLTEITPEYMLEIVSSLQEDRGTKKILRSLLGHHLKKFNVDPSQWKQALVEAVKAGLIVTGSDNGKPGTEWVGLNADISPPSPSPLDSVKNAPAPEPLTQDASQPTNTTRVDHVKNILHFADRKKAFTAISDDEASEFGCVRLPKTVRARMREHSASWDRRRLGIWLEELSDAKRWLPLAGVFGGDVPDADDPDINRVNKLVLTSCVWYYPRSFAGGAFSQLHLGIDPVGRPVAVKIFNSDACRAIKTRNMQLINDAKKRNDPEARAVCDFSEAFRLASQSEVHGGLVKYVSHAHWTHQGATTYALVTELMNMSLDELMALWQKEKCTRAELTQVIPQIALQLITTFRDFHTVPDANGKTMTHNDLNPMNIMIDCRRLVRIIDVGLSYHKSSNASHTVLPADLGHAYRAPEIVEALKRCVPAASDNDDVDELGIEVPFSPESDIYSLGCCLEELLSLADAAGGRHQSTSHRLQCLVDVVRRCKHPQPSQRPSCDQLMTHPLMWSAEKCVTFIANFVNPFLPINNGNNAARFEKVSQFFLNPANRSDDAYVSWLDKFTDDDSTPLGAFYASIGPQHRASYNSPSVVGLGLLRLINNHTTYHHQPHIPYEALLEAFPRLTIDVYDIAVSFRDEFGIGVHEFINPIYDARSTKN